MLNPLKSIFGAVAALAASTFQPRIPKALRHYDDDDAPSRSMLDERKNATFGWKRHRETSPNGFGGTGKRIARIGGYRKGQPGAKLIRKMIRRYGYIPVMLTQPAVVKALGQKEVQP